MNNRTDYEEFMFSNSMKMAASLFQMECDNNIAPTTRERFARARKLSEQVAKRHDRVKEHLLGCNEWAARCLLHRLVAAVEDISDTDRSLDALMNATTAAKNLLANPMS